MKHKMCAQLRYLRSQRSFGWWVVILCCAAARRSEACISPILTIQCYQESPDCSIFFEKPNTDCGGHIFCQLFFFVVIGSRKLARQIDARFCCFTNKTNKGKSVSGIPSSPSLLSPFRSSSAGNLYPGKRKMFVLGKVVCYPLLSK